MATLTSSCAEEDTAQEVVRLQRIVGYLLGRNEELRALVRELQHAPPRAPSPADDER